jgi:hypothetical protein
MLTKFQLEHIKDMAKNQRTTNHDRSLAKQSGRNIMKDPSIELSPIQKRLAGYD